MPPFRFRAQAALDLRREREEAAERALAVAQAAVRAAEAEVQAARDALDTALRDGAANAATATGAHELTWYQNWILRRRQAVAARRQVEQERRADAHRAAQAAMLARRERMALDKLRDRAYRAFQLAERRSEQKELDLMGALTHGSRRQSAGGEP
ncbi:MAG: flagellar FliJ family protein [Vicinamibacterales bacterium]